MREIKFRVFNGSAMEYNVIGGKFGFFYVNPTNNGLDERDTASITPFNTKYPDTVPVMKFTGLKDVNDVDIYEGDIVEVKFDDGGINMVVKFDRCQFYLDGEGFWSMSGSGSKFKVIGNIHQNPELPEVKK